MPLLWDIICICQALFFDLRFYPFDIRFYSGDIGCSLGKVIAEVVDFSEQGFDLIVVSPDHARNEPTNKSNDETSNTTDDTCNVSKSFLLQFMTPPLCVIRISIARALTGYR